MNPRGALVAQLAIFITATSIPATALALDVGV